MIGPSAPNGPPVPMAMAADSGLAIAVRGAMRLCLRRIASIASGMPWPRMIGDHLASAATPSAPSTGAMTSRGVGSSVRNDGSDQPVRPKRARLVSRAMRWTRP